MKVRLLFGFFMAAMVAILSGGLTGCASVGKHTYQTETANCKETDVNYHFDLFDLPHREGSCKSGCPQPQPVRTSMVPTRQVYSPNAPAVNRQTIKVYYFDNDPQPYDKIIVDGKVEYRPHIGSIQVIGPADKF